MNRKQANIQEIYRNIDQITESIYSIVMYGSKSLPSMQNNIQHLITYRLIIRKDDRVGVRFELFKRLTSINLHMLASSHGRIWPTTDKLIDCAALIIPIIKEFTSKRSNKKFERLCFKSVL
jgi:hypothetical protein